jgi:hypothetical protein
MKKLLLSAALVLVTACASGPREEMAAGQTSSETLDVRVNNNLVPPTILTIYLLPTSGPERNLGEAWSSRVSSFRYNGLAPRGQYRLLGRASNNRQMASEIVVLDGVRAIEWNLQSNRVIILRTINDN